MWYPFWRKWLFALEAEKAHHLALHTLDWAPKQLFSKPPALPCQHMGLNFDHPIGLAAGLDKDGRHLDALGKLGFSSIEVGTVTPKAQAGNAKPRLFRLLEDQALINRMGFNNQGVLALQARLQHRRRFNGVLGINIGKNKTTPLQQAGEDYQIALQAIYPYADYVTINISSPNTPDLRRLQEQSYFQSLLEQLLQARAELSDRFQKKVPLLIKISPDESDDSLRRLAAMVADHQLEGMIATNTTAQRPPSLRSQRAQESGGLSGQPLRERANECMHIIRTEVGQQLTLIGVGGIDSAKAARERLDAGADLLQVYSGLIYQGPNLVSNMVKELVQDE